MNETGRRLRRLAAVGIIVLGAYLAGSLLRPPRAANADVRHSPPRQAFLAGGERAVPILQDIAATLKRIDDRLARLEKTVAAAAEQQPRQ
jgi:hypothetical protein